MNFSVTIGEYMINVDFYSFSKRKNSTKKPTGTPHTVSVCFKEETEIERPTIEVHDGTIAGYNYAYIAYTGRYYWVSGKRSIAKDTFEIDLVEDYLASHIDSVRGQNVYCALSSAYYNADLDDSRIIAMPVVGIEQATCDFDIINQPDGDGKIREYEIAAVICEDGRFNGVEIITAWDEPYGNYIKKLSDPTFFNGVKNTITGSDPYKNVCEVWHTPLIPNQCQTVGTLAGFEINGEHFEGDCLLSLDVKPHVGFIQLPEPSYNDFRFSSRFVEYYVKIPFVGMQKIPTELVRESTQRQMRVVYGGDCCSGQFVVTATIAGVTVGVWGGVLKGAIPLSAQGHMGANIAVNAVKGAATGATGGAAFGGGWGALAGAVGGALGATIRSYLEGLGEQKLITASGGIATTALARDVYKPTVIMVEHACDKDPATLTNFGRPTEKVCTVANGYMQTVNASLSFAGTDGEINEVNNAFNGGVYVE